MIKKLSFSRKGMRKRIASLSLIALFFNATMIGSLIPSGDVLNACHGNITIKKVTIPSGSSQEFKFTGCLGNFDLKDGESSEKFYKSAGNKEYTVTEPNEKGWDLVSIVCTGDDNYSSNINNRNVVIDLDNNEDVICTFTNCEDVNNNEICDYLEVTECGDGIVEGDEQCDYGNDNSNESGSICSTECKIRDLCADYENIAGTTVVRFNKGIRSDKGLVEAEAGPVSENILAGIYDITLISYDGYPSRSSANPAGQLHEKWYAILQDSGNNEVASTSAISDLEDGINYTTKEETVNTSFDISTDVASIIAHHDNYPPKQGTSGANSVHPICAVFEYKEPRPETVTIVASKIVCDNEIDLPNWGGDPSGTKVTGEPNTIESNTAQDYVNASNGKCRLVDGWNFQVGDTTAHKEKGNFYGPSMSDTWITFGPTVNGEVETVVDINNIASSQLRLREVLQDGYIPFTYDNITKDNSNNVSAEFYCHNDLHNYDNYDYIRDIQKGETYYCIAFNASIYAPYCGDGIENQEWEQCDNNDNQQTGCSEQCQYVVPQCSDLTLAKITVDEVINDGNGTGNMTSDLFLGDEITKIPSNVWFKVYGNGNYVEDNDIIGAGYENVQGLAVQRGKQDNGNGFVRTLIHGSHPNSDNPEHIHGNIEFWNNGNTSNTVATSVVNDTATNNLGKSVITEKINTDGTAYEAGNDEVTLLGDGTVDYWFTVTVADDSVFTEYAPVGACEESICTDEDVDGYATEGGNCGPVDCDDTNASINPGATEICYDGIDNDCDGDIDEDCYCDPIMARVVIDKDESVGVDNLIYVGGSLLENVYESGEWFPVYENGFIEDPNIEDTTKGYENVPGLAIQRINGTVRAVLYKGTITSERHIEGRIEFYNASVNHLRDDNINNDNNALEGETESGGYIDGNGTKGSAGDDEVWLENGFSNFYLGVTIGDDGYYTDYSSLPIGECKNSFCGDGIVNQEWEECDGIYGLACTEQCQFEGDNTCNDLVLARVNVNEVKNWNDGDMTTNIYLGSKTNVIPNGTWFALYSSDYPENNGYIIDDDISSYEDVPGLAIQRLDDRIRAVIYGSNASEIKEHIYGNIEFYNATVQSFIGDSENGFGKSNILEPNNDYIEYTNGSGINNYNAGDDEIWISNNESRSNFWLTVTSADDGYYTDWKIIDDCIDDCSVSGHKYKYDEAGIAIGLIDWIIGLAQIIDCGENEEWADSVESYSSGTGITDLNRKDSSQATGVAERDDTINFVSLGMGGELVLEFNNLILNEVGNDIEIVETTFGSKTYDDYKEKAKVYASQDGIDWSYLGIAYLDEELDLDNGTLASDETTTFVLKWAKYVKIIDTSIQQGDGYDVDGVKAIHCGNGTIITTTTNNDGEYCFADVDAGSYKLYEEMQSGWQLLKIMSNLSPYPLISFTDLFFDIFVEIEVVDGETITVDFYNEEENGPVNPTLTVNKVLDPDTDPGLFNLLIDSDVKVSDIGNNGTTGAVTLSTGTYTVSETAGTGTDLNDYITTFSGACDVNGDVTLGDGDNAVCTITNTIKTIPNGDVIINEIAWMGTDNAPADEWIELRNMTNQEIILDGWTLNAQNDFPKITLEGSIAANGYYLLERTDNTTVQNITADKIYTGALEDGGEFLELRKADNTLVDEVDASNSWQAGIETTPKHPMELCSDGNWYDSDVAGGTPRAENGCGGNSPFCGDGIVNQNSEKCDDNNNDSFDGCSSSCQIESIFGYKLNDENNNGADDSEPKLSNWTIELYDDVNMITTTETAITSSVTETIGYYSFENLGEGDYWVKEIQQAGWIQTTPTTSIEVNSTAISTQQVVFGNRKTQCFDGIDNDGDTFIDANDIGCWTDENDSNTYDPNDDNEENGSTPVYQCSDGNDNDGDGLIDTDDPGCHTDWDASNASTYVPTDNDEYHPYCGDGACNNNESCSTCSQDCGNCGGGGGGGIIYPKSIIITNEKVIYLGGGEAMVTWTTNIEATRQVAYGDDSISPLGVLPEYGYDSVNTESTDMIKEHSMIIAGLTDGIPYYFRPIADRNGSTGEVVGIEVSYKIGKVKGTEAPTPTPTECNYLLEYIKLGALNNPVEVKKLEWFLNEFEGESLAINGIYEQVDFDAVSRFQEKYLEDVLTPWGHIGATGYVYLTTKKKINELYCQREFPLTQEQEAEVARFSTMFSSLAQGDEIPFEYDIFTPESYTEEGTSEYYEDESGEVAGDEDEGGSEDESGNEEETEKELGYDETLLIDEDDNVLLIGEDEDKDDETSEDNSIVKAFKDFTSWIWLIVAAIIGIIAYSLLFASKQKKNENEDGNENEEK